MVSSSKNIRRTPTSVFIILRMIIFISTIFWGLSGDVYWRRYYTFRVFFCPLLKKRAIYISSKSGQQMFRIPINNDPMWGFWWSNKIQITDSDIWGMHFFIWASVSKIWPVVAVGSLKQQIKRLQIWNPRKVENVSSSINIWTLCSFSPTFYSMGILLPYILSFFF